MTIRFVLAIVSFVLAAAMIGFGIAQKTVLAHPDHITAHSTTTSKATVSVIDGAVLNAYPRSQTIDVIGQHRVFAAYGRTSDVLAWIGDTTYNRLGFDPKTMKLTSELVAGKEKTVPDPQGSDLWLSDFTDARQLKFTVSVPADISVIIVSDGEKPAPSSVSVTWLLDNSTPWVGPLVVGGGIILLLGLSFLLWAVNHMRRSRGPRRKQPKMPKLPRQPRYKPSKQRELAPVAGRGRRAARPSIAFALPVVVLTTLALGGCSTNIFATLSGSAVQTASTGTTTPVAQDGVILKPPAVTVPQAKRIVARISATVTKADTDKNPTLVADRVDGPALAYRTANYAIRKVDTSTKEPQAIPAGPVKLILPQQTDSWPRTFLAIIQSDTDVTVPPIALLLIQDDARSQYKVHYEISLAPGVRLPEVAPPNLGAAQLPVSSKLLVLAPEDVGTAYGDILTLDKDSKSFDLFKKDGDLLREKAGLDAQNVKKAALPSTASITFSNKLGEDKAVALATNASGALVAVSLNEFEVVQPVEAGAAINAPADFAALSGKSLSTKGLKATRGDQLLFFVPKAGSGDKIILLGFTTGLIAAAEL